MGPIIPWPPGTHVIPFLGPPVSSPFQCNQHALCVFWPQLFVASLPLMDSMTNPSLRMVAPDHLSPTGGSQQRQQSNPSVSRYQCQDGPWVRAAPPAGNSFTCQRLILGGVAGWAGIVIRSARVQGPSHQHGRVGAPGKPDSCGHSHCTGAGRSPAVSQAHNEL